MDFAQLGQLSVIGAIGGFMAGFLGIGGGVIIIPLLIYGAGLPLKLVTGVSMVQALFATLSGMIVHRKNRTMNPRLGTILGISAIAGGLIGSFGSALIDARLLLTIYLVLVVVSLLLMFLAPRKERSGELVINPTTIVPTGFGVGVVAGMLGVGGGFILTPIMISVLKIPTKVAVGTSLIVIIMTTIAGAAGKIATGQFDLQIAAFVIVGSIIGAQIGGRVNARVSPRTIRLTLTVLLLGILVVTTRDVITSWMV